MALALYFWNLLLFLCFLIVHCYPATYRNNTRSPTPMVLPVYHVSNLKPYLNSTGEGRSRARTPFEIIGGEYVVRLKIGSGGKIAHLILDTGSPLIWWQCYPCACFHQVDPKYRFQDSTSFAKIDCQQYVCDNSEVFIDGCATIRDMGQVCQYTVTYGDKDMVQVGLGRETVSTLDGQLFPDIVFGCTKTAVGTNFNYYSSGILGFDGHEMSFPKQIGASLFSFCLVHPSYDADSFLYLYDIPDFDEDEDAFNVPLLTHPRTSFHYLQFSGIAINGNKVPVRTTNWEVDWQGRYGVVMDTGTPITRFPSDVYSMFRDQFVREAEDFEPSEHRLDLVLDTCYDLGSLQYYDFPTVTLYFADNKPFYLSQQQTMVIRGTGTYCLAFAERPAESPPVTIIGTYQMKGARLTYDLDKQNVRISPNECG